MFVTRTKFVSRGLTVCCFYLQKKRKYGHLFKSNINPNTCIHEVGGCPSGLGRRRRKFSPLLSSCFRICRLELVRNAKLLFPTLPVAIQLVV